MSLKRTEILNRAKKEIGETECHVHQIKNFMVDYGKLESRERSTEIELKIEAKKKSGRNYDKDLLSQLVFFEANWAP